MRYDHELEKADEKLTDGELRSYIRILVRRLEADGEKAAPDTISKLKQCGIVANMHVGRPQRLLTARNATEWYAGQLLAVLETANFEYVATVVDVLDHYVPEE
jgi:hypothetical protein